MLLNKEAITVMIYNICFRWCSHLSPRLSEHRHSLPFSYQTNWRKPQILLTVKVSVHSGGGALGYFLGGYVPPRTPNWHTVLKKISPKIDTPF